MDKKFDYKIRGGEFLIKDLTSDDIFIPEEFNEEQKMICQTIEDFLETEVYPNLDRIDKQEEGLMPSLLKKAGELGLTAISVPAEYGGFDQDFLTTIRANEYMGKAYSFSVAIMCHTGIGSLPILYYGNEEQKQKYITKLATGEYLGCYCLTEPNAGSDANSGKTKATLSPDGKHYIINGQKMWITNGGFADIQTVFAKIDNDRVLSAFIVERNTPGITFNPEEKKMGIKGSSTRQIFYNDVKVPVENLLGKRGEGFRIALNILFLGRIKLGANTVGASKHAIDQSVKYANERKQFGSLISLFGAIKFKLSEQVIRTFATESMLYRVSYDINEVIKQLVASGTSKGIANAEGCAEFAVECALLKVYGSETQDYCVDEEVQIMGGMGFSAEMPADRAYRDSRINRIFEGTNEINRMLVSDTAMKKAMKGDYDLFGYAKKIVDDLKVGKLEIANENTNYYSQKQAYIKNFKKTILIAIHTANEVFKRQLLDEQEVMMNISDMMMHLYAAESTLLRVQKLEKIIGSPNINVYKDITDVLFVNSAANIRKFGFDTFYSTLQGNELSTMLNAVDALTKTNPVNVKEARRRIANKLIEENKYNF